MAYLSELGRSREGGGKGPSTNLITLPLYLADIKV